MTRVLCVSAFPTKRTRCRDSCLASPQDLVPKPTWSSGALHGIHVSTIYDFTGVYVISACPFGFRAKMTFSAFNYYSNVFCFVFFSLSL
jgi:hypothetical protein